MLLYPLGNNKKLTTPLNKVTNKFSPKENVEKKENKEHQ